LSNIAAGSCKSATRIIQDPVGNPGWAALLERHPEASIFHSPAWLDALRKTYGYEPFVITRSSGPMLDNGLVVCKVKGWVSRRVVSVPFSDHCDALVDEKAELAEMLAHLSAGIRTAGWKSLELRFADAGAQLTARGAAFERGREYCLHKLDLRRELDEIFRQFHPSHAQRAIRKAEREGVEYEGGRSEQLLSNFYQLLRMSRRRHGLPPQPVEWFRNLVACLGDRLTIHQASRDGRPIASVLTLSFKKTITYKYGGSDAAYHRLGGMPFLFWQVIQQARAAGFAELDLGRSDVDQPGLIAFKDHLGATRTTLTYLRYPARHRKETNRNWMPRLARGVVSHLPDSALDAFGRLLYKHLG
jgi:CelD/BcsL family acetyltransferase involved in cellulose biosynthesis